MFVSIEKLEATRNDEIVDRWRDRIKMTEK